MDEKLKKILGYRAKGMTMAQVATEMGMTKGGVSGKISNAKKKGLIPNVDARKNKTKRKYTKRISNTPTTITKMPIEAIQNDTFVVIVGKGQSVLNNILSQLR